MGKNYYSIIQAFFDETPISITAIGEGNINDTYKVSCVGGCYLLQSINHQVFKEPGKVQDNYQKIYHHLDKQRLELQLPSLIKTKDNKAFTRDADGKYWRLITFINDAQSHEQAESLAHVREAASKIGQFVAALNDPPLPDIRETIPDFHHFQKRYSDFEKILGRSDKSRLKKAESVINFILSNAFRIPNYQSLNLPRRLVHNDPKIGNVLFDYGGSVIAVIDWDTVMPGYLATDLGDMIRTMAVNAQEDERDLTKVFLRKNQTAVCIESFLRPLRKFLTAQEKQYLVSGPLYIAMEQALRFLYDYLHEDKYYKIRYPLHNLHRSMNQIELCRSLIREEAFMQETIDRVLD